MFAGKPITLLTSFGRTDDNSFGKVNQHSVVVAAYQLEDFVQTPSQNSSGGLNDFQLAARVLRF